MFNVAEIIYALEITEDEAKYLLSGDAEFKDGEIEKLAELKGVPVDKVKEFFRVAY